MGALRVIRDSLPTCDHVTGCLKYFRKCFAMLGTVVGRGGGGDGGTSDSACAEVCAVRSFGGVRRRRRSASSGDDVIVDRCPAPKCKCCRSLCTKTILVVVNFVFLVCGWALVAFGIWLHLNGDGFYVSHLLRDNPTNPVVVFDRIPFAIIAVGLFVAGTSFMGCCGACAESVCFLSFYSLLVFSTIVAEILISVTVTLYREEISEGLFTSLHYQIRMEYNKSSLIPELSESDVVSLTNAWDTLQARMGCCGVLGPQDYMDSSWYNHTPVTEGIFVPMSCCVQHIDEHAKIRILNENYCQVEAVVTPKNKSDKLGFLYTEGCQPVLITWLHGYGHQVVVFMVSLIFVQFSDFLLACILMTWVRKRHSEYWWCEEDDFE